jgi:threonine dehydratase
VHAPHVETITVAVGGEGLFAGVATAAADHASASSPSTRSGAARSTRGAEAREPVEVTVDSITADAAIVAARRALWEERRVIVE